MGIDLYLHGFTKSEYAKCRQARSQIISIIKDGETIIPLGLDYQASVTAKDRYSPEMFEILSQQPAEDRWAVVCRNHPERSIAGYIPAAEFQDELENIPIYMQNTPRTGLILSSER